MKRFSTGLLIGLLIGVILTIPMYSLAQQPIKLIINGQQIQCDVPPQNINGRVLVPARFVAEPLGATVAWDGTNKAVVINSEKIETTTQIDTNSFPEAQNIEGNIKKVYINPTIKHNIDNSKTIIKSQYEFDDGCFLMMYGKYSNMGNEFILLEGIYKAFPDITNGLKKDLNQMEIRTYKNKQYVNVVNLTRFLRLHFETVNIDNIDENSTAIIVNK
jgi:hypothetical protein